MGKRDGVIGILLVCLCKVYLLYTYLYGQLRLAPLPTIASLAT